LFSSSSQKRTALRSIPTSSKVKKLSFLLSHLAHFVLLEGTLVAKKDPYLNKHSEDIPIPNLEVLSLMKSFTSKGFTRETFNWQYHYFYLTNTGIEYLRQYLALPADIVPATLKAAAPRPPSMTLF
jgi:small subunit ribosomal protein S10e